MIDSYLLLTPILALPLVGLLIFVGCDLVFTLDAPEPDVPILSATPGNNRVDLVWETGVKIGKKFTVKRKEAGPIFEFIDDVFPPKNSFVDFSAMNGVTYTYVVTATGDQETAPSNEVTVTPLASILTAFVENLNQSQLPAAQVSAATNSYGMWFTVGANDLIVKMLGRAFVPGNSLIHLMKIVDTAGTDVVNAFAAVSMAGATTAGEFRYSPVNGLVTLNANTSYFLLSEEKTPGDQIYNRTLPLATTDVAVLEGAVRGTAAPFEQFAGNTAYGPVNFQY